MADFIFRVSPNIILGSYTVSRLGQYAREFGSKFMVIMDPLLKEVNVSDKILQSLTDRKVSYFIYDELTEGANTKTIEQALILARDGHIHGIIAVGGSKALQVGQAVAALCNENHDLYNYVDGAAPTTGAMPLICVPTTIRAPFIYTSMVPVIDARSRQVKLLKCQNSVCRLALIDPNLMMTLTENQSTAMSVETLCIAMEGYLSQRASFFSDMLIEKGVELLGYGLDGSPSLDITTPAEILLSQGGCMASLGAAVSSVGMCSILSLCINARFKISRSLVTSILFPYFIEDAGKYKTDRVEKLAHIMRIVPEETKGDVAVTAFAEYVRQRLAKVNLPTRLKDLSVSIEQLSLSVEDAGQLELMNTLPRSMTSDDLFDMVKRAY